MMKKLREWWNKLFGKKPAPAPAPAPEPAPWPFPTTKPPTFVDDFFKLDLTKWTVSTWSAPGNNATNKGTFLAKNAAIVDGVLRLTLDQVPTAAGVTSKGAEIATNEKFGYGTYEYTVRASSTAALPDDVGSPVSGSITGCFNYLPQSATEIDIEMEGNERSRFTQLTSWINESKPNEHTNVSPAGPLPHETFFDYKFVWTPGKIEYYRNNVLIGTHTKVVPTEAAPFMFNHWGTDNVNWGGLATPDATRYMWVKRFAYTPL